ncbi:MAG: response regulator transcription factor [Planctomycetaceae bacterium]
MNTTHAESAMVFVLDDEPAVCDSLRDLLESEHYLVQTFDSPTKFLQTMTSRSNACLILDLKMPEINGLDVLQALTLRKPKLPTIVLTANAEVPSIVTAMKSGAVNLLEKPCSDQQLLNAVRDALAQSEPHREQPVSGESVAAKLSKLSQREREILKELVAGHNVKQIAMQLGTSPNTVRNQRGSIVEKMEANSMADLVRMVLEAR